MNNTNASVDIYVPEGCLSCKYFKNYFSLVHNVIELKCKKGNKTFLANEPFACGEYKKNKNSLREVKYDYS